MGMGCFAQASNIKRNEDAITDRSIHQESDNPYPAYYHAVTNVACGYGFNLDENQINQIIKTHQLSMKKETEAQKYEQFHRGFVRLKTIYKQHDIDSCLPILSEISKLSESIDYALLQVSQEELLEIQTFLQSIQQEYDQMLRFVAFLQTTQWMDKGQDNGIRMFTCRGEDTVAARMDKIIDIPVQIFLTVLSELDLYTELISDIKESHEQKYIDRNRKIGYCIYDIPIIAKRQAIFEAVGYNRLKHNNSIFMYSQSIHNRPDRCTKLNYTPKLNSKCVQIDYRYLIIKYVPIEPNRGKASVAVNIDMKLDFLPLAFLEIICRTFCIDFFKIVVDASAKYVGSKWEEKVKKHPESFDFFKNIIHSHFQGNRNLNSD